MKSGIVSVTFRQFEPAEIIKLTKKAGLDGIEWGSDLHCPPDKPQTAREIAGLMEENSLETLSYGSYYKLGQGDDFDRYLEIAAILKTDNIRVWAGVKNSEDCDDEYFSACVKEAFEICEKAAAVGVSVSFEYHGGTLTNTQKSTLRLLDEISCENNFTYWQPLANTSHEENIENIKLLCKKGKLKNLHMYHWKNGERLPLCEGRELWREYISACKDDCNAVLLEFVKDDNSEQLLADAAVLKEILSDLN